MMISEKQIFTLFTVRNRGTEDRLASICRSYLFTLNAEFLCLNNTHMLFKRNNFSLVLSVPMASFSTPTYARALINRQLDRAKAQEIEFVQHEAEDRAVQTES